MKTWRMAGLAVALGWVVGTWGPCSAQNAPANRRVVLVELFTSEGCSSCPPADALLRKLDGMRTPDGALIVGLGEHVTYWNSLGWHDRFSEEAFTARQQAYGDRFRLDSVYTPQAVVNGQSQVLGSDEAALLRAARISGASGVGLEISKAQVQGNRVALTYVLRGVIPAGAEVWAAITDDRATTDVKRGENGGRILEHAAVVRSLTQVGKAQAGEGRVSVTSPEVLAGQEKVGRHLVLFVQEAGLGKVLAAESQVL